MTYEIWYRMYLETYKRNLAPKTRESYDQVTSRFILPAFGGQELRDVTPEHVQTAINAAAARGGRQAQIVYAVIHAALRRAYRSQLIGFNPADAIDKPGHDQEAGKALTAADYAAASPLIGEELPLLLALDAGLRRGEIAGLQWGDVDLRAGMLHIRRQRSRAGGVLRVQPPKSRAGLRSVRMTPRLREQLRDVWQLRPTAFVVDLAPETITHRWSRLQERLQLSDRYRLHDLRHTYGTRLILGGVEPRVVQYLMGHSSLDVTMRVYSHCRAEDAFRALDRVYGSLH